MVLVLSIGSIFLCPLVLYYIYLTKKLKDKNKKNVNYVEFFEQNAVDDSRRSIKLILLALNQDSISAVEACIRVSFLAKKASFSEEGLKAIKIFDEVAIKSSHIPILEHWDRLKKDKKVEFEAEIKGLELEYKSKLLKPSDDLLRLL